MTRLLWIACQPLPCRATLCGTPYSNIGRLTLLRRFSINQSKTDSPYDDDYHEFYRYTSGRWLWDEEQQLRNRYRKFNVLELQRTASNVMGAQRCIQMSKIGEGNFNKVFMLTMDNRSVVIARIPHPNAGPPIITTASEVATMDFARTILGIPVPKVLAYSTDATNPVGSEYILMEQAKGVQLSRIWNDMEIDDQANVVRSLVEVESKFLTISFDKSGAIYYAKDMPTCAHLEITGKVSAAVREDVLHRFVIGPTIEREFWQKESTQMPIDRGPWTLAREYMEAIAHREISWIEQYAKPKKQSIALSISDAQNSTEAHIDLLQKYLSVAAELLPTKDDLLLPALWHRDLHKGNIFVHEGQVSNIIDWQSVWVGPRILHARPPRLVDYYGEIQTKLPENFKDLDPAEKGSVEEMVRQSILLSVYESTTAKRNPALYQVMRCPNGKTLEQLLEFAGDTWDGDILPLREVLIRIERDWHLNDAASPCPYHFTKEEVAQHRRDGEGFNENADFWDNLDGRVDQTGYTSNEDFPEAVQYFSELRQTALDTFEGEERENFELQTRWLLQHQQKKP